MIGGFQVGAFQPAFQQSVAAAPPSVSTPGGSGKRYNTNNLDLSSWQKNKKKIEAKIAVVQKKITRKRKQIELAPTLNTEVIARQLMALQSQLLELLATLDEYRKQQELAEDAEVMAIYLAYRRLH